MNIEKIDNKYIVNGSENMHTQDVLESGWLVVSDSQVLFELNSVVFIFDLTCKINGISYGDINDFVQALL